METTARWIATGVEVGVPIARLADWSGLTRQTIYDILERNAR